MSTRLGISIRRDVCAGLIVRRGRVLWRRRAGRDAIQGVGPAIAELLATAPKRRARIRVTVAVGASYAQIKRISGVPSTMRADPASRLVRENVASFFLRSSLRLLTTGVQRGRDGATWSAALDGAPVEEIIDALRAAGFRPPVLVPEPVAASMVLASGTHHVADGEVVAELTITDRGALERVRRVRRGIDGGGRGDANRDWTAQPLSESSPALRSLGEEARNYLAAFAAAACPPNHPLTWRPPADPRRVRSLARLRLGVAATSLVLSATAAAVAPGIRASVDASRVTRIAERGESVRGEADRIESNLRQVTATLDRVDRFASRRDDIPLLLADLAVTLPDSTALLSLRIDSVETSLSVLTPHAADVIVELAHVKRVVSPRILGSVVRDAGVRTPLERATIRFRRQPR
jgi:hypothetical protein